MLRSFLERSGRTDVQVLSAGTYALSGAPASLGAQRAMKRRGLSLEEHKSCAVTGALLETCTLVVGLTQNHVTQLRMMYPRCHTPMTAFDDPPVSDPYGGSDEAYERAALDIQRQLPALIQHI